MIFEIVHEIYDGKNYVTEIGKISGNPLEILRYLERCQDTINLCVRVTCELTDGSTAVQTLDRIDLLAACRHAAIVVTAARVFWGGQYPAQFVDATSGIPEFKLILEQAHSKTRTEWPSWATDKTQDGARETVIEWLREAARKEFFDFRNTDEFCGRQPLALLWVAAINADWYSVEDEWYVYVNEIIEKTYFQS